MADLEDRVAGSAGKEKYPSLGDYLGGLGTRIYHGVGDFFMYFKRAYFQIGEDISDYAYGLGRYFFPVRFNPGNVGDFQEEQKKRRKHYTDRSQGQYTSWTADKDKRIHDRVETRMSRRYRSNNEYLDMQAAKNKHVHDAYDMVQNQAGG